MPSGYVCSNNWRPEKHLKNLFTFNMVLYDTPAFLFTADMHMLSSYGLPEISSPTT